MGMRASVAGASGYAGGELLRLLLAHPELAVGSVTAGGAAGRPTFDLHPHLPALDGYRFAPTEPAILADADVVFLALPHGQSSALAAELPPNVVVIDLGADHRLTDPRAWEAAYGSAHTQSWPYGLPELPGARAALAGVRRIANPGCYPTAVGLGLAPLLAAGLVEPADIVVVAASGTSGAGRAATPELMGSEIMGSVRAYKAGGAHQHIPEMEQALMAAAGSAVTLSFTPLLAPMPRGILATCTAHLASADVTTEQLSAALHSAYDDEPFVVVLPDGGPTDPWPSTAATLGSNACQLRVAADRHAGRAVVLSSIDNLGKGAAGQALQNANLALDLPETMGLSVTGLAP
jgi:N-acetyl-gamma-glutamyl-phosphate reductase